jgi:type I restriction enzyme S subunit
MNNEFIEKSLEDLVLDEKGSIISGPFGSDISSKFFQETGVPVIRGNNLSNNLEKFIDDGFVFLTEKKADDLNAYAVKGDLIFTAAGTIGQVGIIPDHTKYKKYVISNKQLRARLDRNKINPLYAFYWFAGPWTTKNIINKNTGSTVPLINLGILRGLRIKCPKDRGIQDKIVNIIDSISEKISLNNRINAELEQMARTIYNYWFVQFDFPISAAIASRMGKPELEGKPYKASGGDMVWNEELRREIPAGWEVGKLGDVANILMGQSPAGASYNEIGDGIVFFQGSTGFSFRFPEVRMFTTEPSRIANEGDILLSVRAPVGTLNVADQECCIGRGLAALNSKKGVNSYLLCLMFYFKSMFDLQDRSGTTFGSIDKDTLHGLQFPKPPDDIQLKFQSIVGEYDKMILTRSRENQELTQLRDFLLPLLMNGQVRVG